MSFEEAMALAQEIYAAGYHPEVLTCRERGKLIPWHIMYRGGAFDSAVYVTINRTHWQQWRAEYETKYGPPKPRSEEMSDG